MLPVSQYEALLQEVRGLRLKAQHVQQIADPLITGSTCTIGQHRTCLPLNNCTQQNCVINSVCVHPHKMESVLMKRQHDTASPNFDGASSTSGDRISSEDEYGGASTTHLSVCSEPTGGNRGNRRMSTTMTYHDTWPGEQNLWISEPANSKPNGNNGQNHHTQDVASVMSFNSSSGGVPMLDRVLDSPNRSQRSSPQLDAKVDMVYSLLAMLGGQEHADMGETLLALSTNPESCLAMRQSSCIPLLVQLLQSDKDARTRLKASQALHNLVHAQPDEKVRKREIRIFKLLETIRSYTESFRFDKELIHDTNTTPEEDEDKHPVQSVAHLMKLSFDEGHRQAICQLGGIYTIASLVEAEHVIHGNTVDEAQCLLMRRYACMALTNLTFGDSGNKALLCSFKEFMKVLISQLQNLSDELRQVTASVLRNLSWRADSTSKEILHEIGSVTGLMRSAMLDNKENTLKSMLSALWNLSAHCTENKSEICSVDGALGFLVDMLTYKTPSKSLAIIENSGGILRNISSQIAVRDDYRAILRKHNCLQILLDQLKSPSLTIVSNACGTLWNLSAKCVYDQELLWQMDAPTMLRSLNHSKHKMIAMGSSAALKNLLSARPTETVLPPTDSTALAMDLPALPTLGARKQKALIRDLDQTLSETYENIEKEFPKKLLSKSQLNNYINKTAVVSTDNNITSPAEFVKHFIYDDNFYSLNIDEPSTSGYDSNNSINNTSRLLPNNSTSGRISLPYYATTTEITNQTKKMKVNKTNTKAPKNNIIIPKYRRKSSSSSINCDQNKNDDQEIIDKEDEIVSFPKNSSNVNNNNNNKLKEATVHNMDEKDRCSIDDVSSSDNSSDTDKSKLDSMILSCDNNELFATNNDTLTKLPFNNKDSYDGSSRQVDSGFQNETHEDHHHAVSLSQIVVDVQDNGRTETIKSTTSANGLYHSNSRDQCKLDAISSLTNNLPSTSNSDKYCNIQTKSDNLINYCDNNNVNNIFITDSSSTLLNKSLSISNSRINKNPTKRQVSGLPTRRKVKQIIKSGASNNNTDNGNLTMKLDDDDDDRLKEEEALNNGVDNNILLISHNSSSNNKMENNFQIIDDEERYSTIVDESTSNQESSINIEDNYLATFNDQRPPRSSTPIVISSNNSKPIGIATKQFHPNKNTIINDDINDKLVDHDDNIIVDNHHSNDVDCLSVERCGGDDELSSSNTTSQINNRMLDPDAMIESLDRFTAELVSQASHLQNRNNISDNNSDTKYQNINNNNIDATWNDDTLSNDVTFPSISSNIPNVVTFNDNNKSDDDNDIVNNLNNVEQQSNEFTSINDTTMTESTLIAIEATKLVTVFKNEIEMTQSIINTTTNNSSAASSLELDQIQPPSIMNSLNNSFVSLSPKLARRKKSLLSTELMMRKAALTNSSIQSSVDSLDQINPAIFDDGNDMTMISTSLPNDSSPIRPNFRCDYYPSQSQSPNNLLLISQMDRLNEQNNIIAGGSNGSISDLDNINPPSIFNEITDLCSSLADVASETTDYFEDCYTHTIVEPSEADTITTTELFTDANSSTPISSDLIVSVGSSLDSVNTPKKIVTTTNNKTIIGGKNMTSKQRRNLARDRYKTYTIAAEMVMKQQQEDENNVEQEKQRDNSVEVPKNSASSNVTTTVTKLTPKERRKIDQSRYHTRVIDDIPAATTLNPAHLPSSSSVDPTTTHLLLQREANLILKTLKETTTTNSIIDELIDCETLSLVSNDDDYSEQYNANNYKTYHKSWGFGTKPNIPLIQQTNVGVAPTINDIKTTTTTTNTIKPKIIKPSPSVVVVAVDSSSSSPVVDDVENNDENNKPPPQGKGIRGRRKPLYSKSNVSTSRIKPPVKSVVNSHLLTNVTTAIRSGARKQLNSNNNTNKTVVGKPVVSKPSSPSHKAVVSSGYGQSRGLTKLLPVHNNNKVIGKGPVAVVLERQGTFTKDVNTTSTNTTVSKSNSKIPTTRIPLSSRLPTSSSSSNAANKTTMRSGFVKSISSDRASNSSGSSNLKTCYSRSTSADNNTGRIKSSISNHSLKNDRSSLKKNSIPQPSTTNSRSNSNTNLGGGPNNAKKQVTSKIASLWKKIEASKNQVPSTKKDSRVWIQAQIETNCDGAGGSNEVNCEPVVVMRNKTTATTGVEHDDDESVMAVKRISRLGSFIIMDETTTEAAVASATAVNAMALKQ